MHEQHGRVAVAYLQPAVDIRSAVRAEKGLPIIINMLSPSHLTIDVIARTAAVCLRNLAIDPKNKELIGKKSGEPMRSAFRALFVRKADLL